MNYFVGGLWQWVCVRLHHFITAADSFHQHTGKHDAQELRREREQSLALSNTLCYLLILINVTYFIANLKCYSNSYQLGGPCDLSLAYSQAL